MQEIPRTSKYSDCYDRLKILQTGSAAAGAIIMPKPDIEDGDAYHERLEAVYSHAHEKWQTNQLRESVRRLNCYKTTYTVESAEVRTKIPTDDLKPREKISSYGARLLTAITSQSTQLDDRHQRANDAC